ncbi:hypothetical protein C8J56DRAFT_903298 [Mycena floridula]|nr:hypothetical protein C8J56DRAFT_903298 [Mycena floridula]
MKLDSAPLLSANAASIASSLPSKFTVFGTIITIIVVTLLGQYSSFTRSLEVLHILKSDIDRATGETLAISALDPDFIFDINHSRDQFRISASECRMHYYHLSTTSWHTYPLALMRLMWSIRAAKKDGRALLNRIRAQGESEKRRRLLWDVEQSVIN